MKKIIVTGASSGIGYSTALKLANDGHHVFAIARSEKNLLQLAEESYVGKITPIIADLTQNSGIDIISSVLNTIDSIDVLI